MGNNQSTQGFTHNRLVSRIIQDYTQLQEALLDLIQKTAISVGKVEARAIDSLVSTFVRPGNKTPLPEYIPIMFVLLMISIIHFVFTGMVVSLFNASFFSLLNLSFQSLTAMVLWCFNRCVATNPGEIPNTRAWRGYEGSMPPREIFQERKKSDGSFRWCSTEEKYKPDRSHFCDPLGRNVLKMDHYCPWMNNCIGFYNYKYFVLFILYAVLSVNLSGGMFLYTLLYEKMHVALYFLLAEGLSVAGVLSLVLTPFLGFHMYLVSQNSTTIEMCGSDKPAVNIYNLGICRNFTQLFNYNPLLWPFPVGKPVGTGLVFPINKAGEEEEERSPENSTLVASLGTWCQDGKWALRDFLDRVVRISRR